MCSSRSSGKSTLHLLAARAQEAAASDRKSVVLKRIDCKPYAHLFGMKRAFVRNGTDHPADWFVLIGGLSGESGVQRPRMPRLVSIIGAEVPTADISSQLEAQIPRLRRYAHVLCRNPEDADELVQDCLYRALCKSRLFQPGSNLRAWLFTILHNLYVNSVRRDTRDNIKVPLDDVEPLLTERPAQGGGLTLRDLDRAMTRLSEEQRQVLLLVGLEVMSYDEVASILALPVGTVRSRLSRGREELRHMLDGEAPRPRHRDKRAGPRTR
jgi:RNA polymerase sigma-70 factor (ECF subfamily)